MTNIRKQANDNKRIARNTLFLYVRMAISLIVSLYTSRVVLNTLGVVDYGINNVIAGFVSMFAFLNSSLTASIQRYYNYERGQNGIAGIQSVYKVAVISQFLLALLVFILVESVGIWYLNNELVLPPDRFTAAEFLFHLSLASLLLLILQIPYSAAIVSYEKMDYYAFVGVLDTFLRLGVVIALPYVPFDKLIIYGFLGFFVSAFNYGMYYVYAKRQFIGLSFDRNINFNMLKEMISFSGWNAFGSFAVMMRSQGVNLILNIFFGPVVNAARGVAYSIQSAMMGFIQNISTAARPQLTEAYACKDYSRSTSLMFSVSKVCFIMLYMMVLPVGSEIHYVLHLWLGESVPMYTGVFTILIFSISLVDVLNMPVSMIMLATGRVAKYNMVASIVGLFVLPISYIVLRMGAVPLSVFIVSLFISIVVQVVCVYIMQSVTTIKVSIYFFKVGLPLICLVVMTFFIPSILHLGMDEGMGRMVCSLLISILSVGYISYFVVLNKSERVLVKNIVSKFVVKAKK